MERCTSQSKTPVRQCAWKAGHKGMHGAPLERRQDGTIKILEWFDPPQRRGRNAQV